MHAVGYRPHLSYVALALATLFVLGAAIARSPRSRSCPGMSRAEKQRVECPHTRAYSVQLADSWYRGKRFDAAEQTLRAAAKCESVKVAEELHVIASFYHQLGYSWERAQVVPYRDRLAHLDWATQFDAMLGGAHADELAHRKALVLSAIGPQ